MRYSISLVVLTLLAAAALKGSLTFSSENKAPIFLSAQQQNTNSDNDYNPMAESEAAPQGLNDQAQQYWHSLTPEQKAAVKQDIQNGMDPNQAVLNYAQKNNQQPSNVEGEGSHSTSENYDSANGDSLEQSLNDDNNSSKPITQNKMTSDAQKYSGSGSSEDETDDNNRGKEDPSERTPYAPGGETSPPSGNSL